MDKRTTGVILFCTGGLLKGIAVISAAIVIPEDSSYSYFDTAITFADDYIASISLALVVTGVIYLILAEISCIRNFIQKKN
jgi:hypothetical protein